MATGQPAEEEDGLDEGILDEGRHLTPIDDLASPEDDYFLGLEYTKDQAEEIVVSPPRPPAMEFTFTRPAADVGPLPQPATPAVMEPPAQLVKLRPNYQMRPKGTCLIELPLT